MRRALSITLATVGLAASLPAVLGAYSAVHAAQGHTGPNPGTLAPCAGNVITVHGDDPVGCDLTPPQRLDITGITVDQCDQLGGEPIALTLTAPIVCEGVDY